MTETSWKELGSRPSTGRTKEDRQASARKAAETREEHEAPAQIGTLHL